MCSTPRCNCSPRNRRACRRSLDTTPRWQNSIGPLARRALTAKCSLTSRRAPRKQGPTTPAAAWMQKENQSTVTIASCEVRLEDPELPIPNKLTSKIPGGQASEKLEASNIKARGAIFDFLFCHVE